MQKGGPPSAPSGTASPDGQRSDLLHLPFYAELAELEGREHSPEWYATVAGLVVLRIVDRWVTSPRLDGAQFGRRATTLGTTELSPAVLEELAESARHAVDAVARTHAHYSALRRLCEAAAIGSSSALASSLLVYGQALHAEGRWSLAADVYDTLHRLAAAPRAHLSSTLRAIEPVALERLGHSRRMLGDLTGATAAYADARRTAQAAGDVVRDLRIRLSEANLLLHVGNLPAALDALNSTLSVASNLPEDLRAMTGGANDIPIGDDVPFADLNISTRDIIALARHDRGAVAARRGDHSFALEEYFAAWRRYRDPIRRARAWFDLAQSLATIGLRSAAKDAFIVVHATARDRELRLSAATNLLELSALENERPAFDYYHAELDRASSSGVVPAWLAPWIEFYAGDGEARFGHTQRARIHLERAVTLATQARVNEVVMRADAVLTDLASQRASSAPCKPGFELTAPVDRITRVVRRVRRRVRSIEPWRPEAATPGIATSQPL